MASVANHPGMVNENSKQAKNVGKAIMGKSMPGKVVGGATRPAGRRALAEVGNLVESSAAATQEQSKKMPATKPGVVTRMAAKRAAAAQQQGKQGSAPAPDVLEVSSNTFIMGGEHYGVAVSTNAPIPVQPQTQKMSIQKMSTEDYDDEESDLEDETEEDDDVVEIPSLKPAGVAQKPASSSAWDHGLECRADKSISTSALLMAFSEEANGQHSGVTDMVTDKECDIDIDWEDKSNPQAVSDYVENIYAFYRKAEKEGMVPQDYMSRQSDINENMRAILLDWLIEVHLKFKLMPETMYLTSNLIDRYLAVTPVTRRNLQLVGVTAMLVASKYEEIWAPEVKDFVYISDNAYSRDQILSLEKHMLNSLKFHLTVPTPYVFATRFIKAAAASNGGSPAQNAEADKQTYIFVWYLLELCLPEYCMLRFSPSMLAASAVLTALMTASAAKKSSSLKEASFTTLTLSASTESSCIMDEQLHSQGSQVLWSALLVRHTGFTAQDLQPCVEMMISIHQKAGGGNLKAVHKKYSSPRFGAVARMMPPCTSFARSMDSEMGTSSATSITSITSGKPSC